jgi:CubicO group peptidase (beta-lactamase class C family)
MPRTSILPAVALLCATALTGPATRGREPAPGPQGPSRQTDAVTDPSRAPLPDLADDSRLADLPERWAGVMDLFRVPGMAVAVVADGRVMIGVFGHRDAAGRLPVTRETLFYTASVTKTFTATAAVALAADGVVSLDDPVRRHRPRLRLADPDLTERLTLEDLLTHRPGLRSRPITLLDAFTGDITEDRTRHWLARAEIRGGPAYSNLHYTLLGRALEGADGRSWRRILEERILQPAGMDRTTTSASRMMADPDHAEALERTSVGWRPVQQQKTDRTMHAAGGLAISARDAGRWLLLHLGGGVVAGRRILPEASVRSMQQVHEPFPEPMGSLRIMEGVGLSWLVGRFNGHRLCQHDGRYSGALAYLALLPDDGAGVAVLMNAGGMARGLLDIVALDLLERLTNTRSDWSAYDEFTAEARRAGPPSGGGPDPVPAELSLPIGMYTGCFHSAAWGTLCLRARDGALEASLGDMELGIAGRPGMPDALDLLDLEDEPVRTLPTVRSDGTVEEIIVHHPEYGPMTFRR